MKALSTAIAAISGLTAGTAFCGGILALGIIVRAMALCDARSANWGWAFALGAATMSYLYLSGASIPLGAWAGWLALLIGGAFVGMSAAALAELMELMPVMLVNSRVRGLALPAIPQGTSCRAPRGANPALARGEFHNRPGTISSTKSP